MGYEIGQDVGQLKAQIDTLAQQVQKLTEQMETLNGVLNKGKGVQFALLTIPGVLGFFVAVLGYFGVKLTIGQ